jgi:hypothetical protein
MFCWKAYQLAIFLAAGCALIYWGDHDPRFAPVTQHLFMVGVLALIPAYLGTVALDWWLQKRRAKQRSR